MKFVIILNKRDAISAGTCQTQLDVVLYVSVFLTFLLNLLAISFTVDKVKPEIDDKRC